MTSKKPYRQVSPQSQTESLKIAKSIQRPNQTKEQTKLIAQGIQKGIELYKKKQKAKSRELDKKLKKAKLQQQNNHSGQDILPQTVIYKQSRLAWILLFLSWIVFAISYFIFEY